MHITEIFYPHTRHDCRSRLETHHRSKPEIWLQRFVKASGKPCITYDELAEECFCFGWCGTAAEQRSALLFSTRGTRAEFSCKLGLFKKAVKKCR
jgi:hypothetical protein